MEEQRADDPGRVAATRRDIERWFIAEGVPHFIVDYSASHFVLTRAAPVLVLYLLATTVLAVRVDASLLQNALALGVAAAVVLGGWAALNRARGRPWRALPSKVGAPEVLAFLFLPAIPPIVLGLQLSDAALAVLESAIFLGLVYVATSYGIVAVTRWAIRRVVAQRGGLGRLLTRALPLLMVFIVFTIVQSDTWHLADAMGAGGLLLLILLFLLLGAGFLVGQLAPEIRRLSESGTGWEQTLATARETPAAPCCDDLETATPRPIPMRWHEWVNVGVVVVFGQGLQILLVTLALFLALLVFGVLLFPPSLQVEWAGAATPTLASATLLGREFAITGALFDVALMLGAICGLYFTVSALSDERYRAEFFSDADRELEQVFAARTVYRMTFDPAVGRGADTAGDLIRSG
ncbi:MAG: hypothetical protein U0869_23630 [Chloroflexota bacterium]